ncbi:hypothetical protein, partial [Enterococcus canis]|uniref:hypothetical protein n=1 Tax=Enterococcus canis TaxID=214095 RepID=UPI001C3F28B9
TTIPSRIFACLLKKASIGYGRPYPKIPNGMLVRFHLIPIKSPKAKKYFTSGLFCRFARMLTIRGIIISKGVLIPTNFRLWLMCDKTKRKFSFIRQACWIKFAALLF